MKVIVIVTPPDTHRLIGRDERHERKHHAKANMSICINNCPLLYICVGLTKIDEKWRLVLILFFHTSKMIIHTHLSLYSTFNINLNTAIYFLYLVCIKNVYYF